MLAYTYIEHGKFKLLEKPRPEIRDSRDAIIRVTLSSICTSDLHIKHGSVPRAIPGITVGHEMVGVVEQIGADVLSVKPGDRVTVNVETFCGECFFCRHGYVNNCTDPNGGWALGCRIDGGQAQYVRVPFADQGLNCIPDAVSDEQALFVGDILATGFWATRISEISEEDTVLIIGAGPTGICTLLCTMLKKPQRIIVCEKSPDRIHFIREHYPDILITEPENCKEFVLQNSDHGGADVVLEVAGGEDTFRLAWECARPNATVTVIALYDKPQILPLPYMYGKNLTFKTGGVDGCDCAEILTLIEKGKIDTTPLITHRFPLTEIEKAYHIFENREDGVIPSRASAKVNICFNTNHRMEDVVSWVQKNVIFSSGQFELKYDLRHPGYYNYPEREIKLLQQAVEHSTGMLPHCGTAGAASSASALVQLCPVIEFGFANALMHRVNESAKVEDIYLLEIIYKDFIRACLNSNGQN